MADTRQELEAAVFDLAARVATVRAALSGAITNDEDRADGLDVLEGCYRVLGDAMDSMWTAWERFDQGEMREGGPEWVERWARERGKLDALREWRAARSAGPVAKDH